MRLYFVTSNPHKIKAAKNLLKDIDIQSISFDLKEIQDTSRNVAIKKAQDAYSKIKKPLIIVDSSFRIKALNDFPDSYASYVEQTLKDDGILKLMQGKTNREASYVDILVYIDKYGYQIFESETKGKISLQSFESQAEPFDKIFIRENDEYPVAYYDNLGDLVYENDIYLKLSNFLKKRKVARGITFFDNKVLLLYRERKEGDNILSYYSIPGGGVEKDETLEETVIREIKEETNINVKIDAYLGMDEYDEGVCYYYLTNYQNGEIELGGYEKEQNNPDNFYQIELIEISKIPDIKIYGRGQEMILKAYQIYQNK